MPIRNHDIFVQNILAMENVATHISLPSQWWCPSNLNYMSSRKLF